MDKGRVLAKIGTRGAAPGEFTWPRGVAVDFGQAKGTNQIVVADSSNHRVQVLDWAGKPALSFGTYGSSDGQFDCLAGVAFNRVSGTYAVSDRYNHRVQLFDPLGAHLGSFGCFGRGQGQLNLPWGVACDATSGQIFVCDKDNHRVQVFTAKGVYLRHFGSLGGAPGQLQNPHYIAVQANKVLVSDTNNHRCQLFETTSGRLLGQIGLGEGSLPGQFKFPRGVAMDELGYAIVGDSGNNRIQIFNPSGQFVKVSCHVD